MENLEKVDPQIKEQINKEGWVGDETSGARVTIGTKEELQPLENEYEKVADMATFIKLNKRIILTKEEIENSTTDEVLKARLNESKAFIWSASNLKNDSWRYIDKDGNLAEFKLKFENIDSFKGLIGDYQGTTQKVVSEFKSLGFKIYGSHDIEAGLNYLVGAKKKKLEQEAETIQKDQFDF